MPYKSFFKKKKSKPMRITANYLNFNSFVFNFKLTQFLGQQKCVNSACLFLILYPIP